MVSFSKGIDGILLRFSVVEGWIDAEALILSGYFPPVYENITEEFAVFQLDREDYFPLMNMAGSHIVRNSGHVMLLRNSQCLS